MLRSVPRGVAFIVAGLCITGGVAVQGGTGTREAVATRLSAARAYTGSLVVYTAREEFNDGDILYYPHTSYEIRTADGQHLRGVRNHLGNNDEHPEMVELPAGKYLVLGDSEREGRVTVPVTVKPGGVTIVNLQRDRPVHLPLALR